MLRIVCVREFFNQILQCFLVMRNKIFFILFFFQLICVTVFGDVNDSIFILEIKSFVYKEIGMELKGDLFTKWNKEDKPYQYVYVSLADSIKSPPELKSAFIFCGTDEEQALKKAAEYKEKGNQVFCYKTYANSGALLNSRFISYSGEIKCFILFHELIHNYLSQEKIKIPYEFNEALADVIGNYGALDYSTETKKTDLALTKKQICINEKLYKCMNSFISRINSNPEKARQLDKKCNKRIHSILESANTFQRDRFNYEVNNAYLVKNQYYSKNYFLLKKILRKQKSIKGLLEIMKHLPERVEDCVIYLKKYT